MYVQYNPSAVLLIYQINYRWINKMITLNATDLTNVTLVLSDEGYKILADFFSCHNDETNDAVAKDFLESGMTVEDYLKSDRSTNIILQLSPV